MVIVKPRVVTEQQKAVQHKIVKDVIRESIQEYRWAQAVKARAGRKCEECGATENLTAHHIHGLKDIIEEHDFRDAAVAMAHPATFDVKNGICVCPVCHAKKHPENQ